AAAALLDLADHLVAVHRPLGEQRDDRRPHVAATHARRSPALVEGRAQLLHRLPHAGPRRSEAEAPRAIAVAAGPEAVPAVSVAVSRRPVAAPCTVHDDLLVVA